MRPKIQGAPWAQLHILCGDTSQREHRQKVCEDILEYFERTFSFAPEPRVTCIFDGQDHEYLKAEFGGRANRGVHWPIRGQGITSWPPYTYDLIAPPDGRGNVRWPFASVIYLHGSTCANDISLTMTFAHELQHFEQYVYRKPLWAANVLLRSLRGAEFRSWWDFPIEIEARATAKKVAETLFGKESVRDFVTSKIHERVTETDAADWTFIQGINTAKLYDISTETVALVQRYRQQLEALLEGLNTDRDFAELDLDNLH